MSEEAKRLEKKILDNLFNQVKDYCTCNIKDCTKCKIGMAINCNQNNAPRFWNVEELATTFVNL